MSTIDEQRAAAVGPIGGKIRQFHTTRVRRRRDKGGSHGIERPPQLSEGYGDRRGWTGRTPAAGGSSAKRRRGGEDRPRARRKGRQSDLDPVLLVPRPLSRGRDGRVRLPRELPLPVRARGREHLERHAHEHGRELSQEGPGSARRTRPEALRADHGQHARVGSGPCHAGQEQGQCARPPERGQDSRSGVHAPGRGRPGVGRPFVGGRS